MALLASPDVGVRGRALLVDFSVLVAPLARESFRSLDVTPILLRQLVFRFRQLCSICYKIDSQ
jgi:hypothetical protein